MNRRHAAMIAALSLIWGASFMFIKVADRQFNPAALVWFRLLLACAVLVPAALAIEGRLVAHDTKFVFDTALDEIIDDAGQAALGHLAQVVDIDRAIYVHGCVSPSSEGSRLMPLYAEVLKRVSVLHKWRRFYEERALCFL